MNADGPDAKPVDNLIQSRMHPSKTKPRKLVAVLSSGGDGAFTFPCTLTRSKRGGHGGPHASVLVLLSGELTEQVIGLAIKMHRHTRSLPA